MAIPSNQPLLDQLDRAFIGLSNGRRTFAVDGTHLHPGLPQRPIPVTELRSILLHPSTSFEARDAGLGEVIRYAQSRDEGWTTAALGLLLHGLRRIAGRLARGYTGDIADLDAEIVEGALKAIRTCDVSKDGVASRILWAAYRQGLRTRGMTLDSPLPSPGIIDTASAEGHPDLILEQAIVARVISSAEAELISATRIDRIKVPALAAASGSSADTVRHRRRRAEQRLVAWIKAGAR